MPNHCSNCLYVYGTRKRRDAFIGYSMTHGEDGSEQFDLHKFVDVRHNDTYSGHIEAWNTKWNCYETRVEKKSKYDKIYFKTAWCPYNVRVQQAIIDTFPLLTFKLLFAERGYGSYTTDDDNRVVDFIEKCRLYPKKAMWNRSYSGKISIKPKCYDELYQTSG